MFCVILAFLIVKHGHRSQMSERQRERETERVSKHFSSIKNEAIKLISD